MEQKTFHSHISRLSLRGPNEIRDSLSGSDRLLTGICCGQHVCDQPRRSVAGQALFLMKGMTEDQLKTVLIGDSVEFHSMMGMGVGLADIHSDAGNYKLMLSTSDHKLAGFSVIGADTVSPINNDSLQSWFDSNVKALHDAKHSTGNGIKDLPYEAWSSDDIEWRMQTVQNKAKTKTHTIYMVTFTPDKN
jgi:hypothetical protein